MGCYLCHMVYKTWFCSHLLCDKINDLRMDAFIKNDISFHSNIKFGMHTIAT